MSDDAPEGGAPIESSLPVAWRTSAALVVVGAAFAIFAHAVDPTGWLTADGLRAAVGAEWYAPIAYVAIFVGAMFLPVPKIILLGLAGVLFWAVVRVRVRVDRPDPRHDDALPRGAGEPASRRAAADP